MHEHLCLCTNICACVYNTRTHTLVPARIENIWPHLIYLPCVLARARAHARALSRSLSLSLALPPSLPPGAPPPPLQLKQKKVVSQLHRNRHYSLNRFSGMIDMVGSSSSQYDSAGLL